jgi:alpha-glucoside transport system substrate-binding protein
MSSSSRRALAAAASLAAAALLFTGCAPAGDDAAAGDCSAYSAYAGNEGKEVEVYTTIIDPEAALFVE